VDGKSQQVISELYTKPGVVAVDLLEGSPGLIVVVEAAKRQELVRFIMQALDSVELITEDLRFFITRESSMSSLARIAA
jgi:hypothetical protein